jgi:hypothetical protein
VTGKVFPFSFLGKVFPSEPIYGTQKVFRFSRAQFLLWQQRERKNDLSLSSGHFFCAFPPTPSALRTEGKSHYFGMDDERPAAVNLIRKPFLIRFRNRKYPFAFVSWPEGDADVLDFPERRYICASSRRERQSCCDFIAFDNKFHDLKAPLDLQS